MAAVGGDHTGLGTCVGRVLSPPSPSPSPAGPPDRPPPAASLLNRPRPPARPQPPGPDPAPPLWVQEAPARERRARRWVRVGCARCPGRRRAGRVGSAGRTRCASGEVGLPSWLFLLMRLSAPSFRALGWGWGVGGGPERSPGGRRSRQMPSSCRPLLLTPCSVISESRPRLVSLLGPLILPARPPGPGGPPCCGRGELVSIKTPPCGRRRRGGWRAGGAGLTCSRGASPRGASPAGRPEGPGASGGTRSARKTRRWLRSPRGAEGGAFSGQPDRRGPRGRPRVPGAPPAPGERALGSASRWGRGSGGDCRPPRSPGRPGARLRARRRPRPCEESCWTQKRRAGT